MFNKKGFSLVELMIVVAIIGILAAIAIPNYVAMQLKAKRSEAPGNVDGIKTAELSYDAAFDTYVSCGVQPTGGGGKTPTTWDPSSAGFATIGWKPDGEVRGLYAVGNVGPTDFSVSAHTDVDGDSVSTTYYATTSINATLISANDIY